MILVGTSCRVVVEGKVQNRKNVYRKVPISPKVRKGGFAGMNSIKHKLLQKVNHNAFPRSLIYHPISALG